MLTKCLRNCRNSPGYVATFWDQQCHQALFIFIVYIHSLVNSGGRIWYKCSNQSARSTKHVPGPPQPALATALASSPPGHTQGHVPWNTSASQSNHSLSELSQYPLQPKSANFPNCPQSLKSQAASGTIYCNLRTPLKPCTPGCHSPYLLQHQPARLPGDLRHGTDPLQLAYSNHPAHVIYTDIVPSRLGERAVLSNSCKQTQKVKQNEKI